MNDDEQLPADLRDSLLRAIKINSERAAADLATEIDPASSINYDEVRARTMADLYRERVIIEEKFRQHRPREAAFWGIAPATCQDVEQTLVNHPDVGVLQYFLCEERLLIFLTTADETRATHTNISKQDLTRQIQRYRRLIEMQGKENLSVLNSSQTASVLLDEISLQLYQALIAPIEAFLPQGIRLCIIPHSVLHYLPLNALRTERGNYLMEEIEILYAVSSSIFDWCYNQNVDRANTRIVTFANPTIGDGGWDLPLAGELWASLAETADVRLFSGSEANKQAFWQHAPEAAILALDVHNVFNKNYPLSTALRLAPVRDNNGAITVREIYLAGKGAFRGRLAVAAVCDGNLGEDTGTAAEDELTTLARALHYAGFPTVITSLWRVHDLSAWFLMEFLYGELLKADNEAGWLPAGEALRKAQMHVARLSGGQALERCLNQRRRVLKEDSQDIRAAWLEISAIAWIEVHCGNFPAAEQAYECARDAFESAGGDYKNIVAAIDHDVPILRRLREMHPQIPDYERPIFAHPYYWAPFILLGRWSC